MDEHQIISETVANYLNINYKLKEGERSNGSIPFLRIYIYRYERGNLSFSLINLIQIRVIIIIFSFKNIVATNFKDLSQLSSRQMNE